MQPTWPDWFDLPHCLLVHGYHHKTRADFCLLVRGRRHTPGYKHGLTGCAGEHALYARSTDTVDHAPRGAIRQVDNIFWLLL